MTLFRALGEPHRHLVQAVLAVADRQPPGKRRNQSAPDYLRDFAVKRRQTRGPAAAIQKVLGLEAKLRQYEQGERFIETVEGIGGPTLLARAFEGPEWLPSLAEIREPAIWVERVRAAPALAG